MTFYVYILTDDKNTKFIVNFTQNLVRAIHEMKNSAQGFFSENQINKLVYFEPHEIYEDARRREREIISWNDEYTRTIVSLHNAKFEDLYDQIF